MAKTLNMVDAIYLAGLNSHVEPYYTEWTDREDNENRDEPHTCDPIAVKVDRELYKQMGWGLQREDVGMRINHQLPLIVATPANQDHYLSFKAQVDTAVGFANSHKNLRIVLIPTNGRHDPVASFKMDGFKVTNGEVLGEFFKFLLRDGLNAQFQNPGLHQFNLKSPYGFGDAVCSPLLAF